MDTRCGERIFEALTSRRGRWTAAAAALLLAASALGYETDPYTKRHLDIADSLVVLDAKVNDALDDIAASWPGATPLAQRERLLILAVYRELGGIHWVDKLERWAIEAPEVAKIPVSRSESFVGDFPLYAGRVAAIFGFGPTINIGGVYVGTDKIGHFFSQGRKFYRRYRRLGDEAAAARWSTVTETGLFGRLMTGVLSNADLVANYEGYRFYRGLLHDGVVNGKPALIRWREGGPERQRRFTWTDHVNPFWDEALNPNVYGPALLRLATERLLRLCGDFLARPERYRVQDAGALLRRYRHLGLRDTQWLAPSAFLGANCKAGSTAADDAGSGRPPAVPASIEVQPRPGAWPLAARPRDAPRAASREHRRASSPAPVRPPP